MSKIQILVVFTGLKSNVANIGDFFLIVQDGHVEFPRTLFQEKFVNLIHSPDDWIPYWEGIVELARPIILQACQKGFTGVLDLPGYQSAFICEIQDVTPQNEFSELILEHAKLLELADE